MGGVAQHPGGHHPVGVGLELQEEEQVQPPGVRLVAPRLHLHAPDHVADALAQVRADVLGGQAFEGVEPERPEHAVGGVGDEEAQEVADPCADGRRRPCRSGRGAWGQCGRADGGCPSASGRTCASEGPEVDGSFAHKPARRWRAGQAILGQCPERRIHHRRRESGAVDGQLPRSRVSHRDSRRPPVPGGGSNHRVYLRTAHRDACAPRDITPRATWEPRASRPQAGRRPATSSGRDALRFRETPSFP